MENSLEVNSIDSNAEPVVTKSWKPTPVQSQVLKLPDSVFEALGGGAAGGGKTDLGLMIPPARQFTEHPKFKGLVLRRTFADLEKEIVPRQQEWYAPMGAVYNETKKVWKFASGARIQNGHAEREQDVRKYDSAEYNYIDWDESTHFSEFQYLYLSISRCRSSSPDLPAIVRSFSNPGNIGHGFFKSRFVDPSPGGKKIIIDKVTGQKRIYIPFLGKDNPHLILNDPGYLARLEALPETERKAKLHGDWNSYEGQIFSEFRPLHLYGEPENALHVIEPFPIPDWWPRVICCDWGFDAMTFIIWAAIGPTGRVYIYRTAAWKRALIKVWAVEASNLTQEHEKIEDFVICHSANQNRGEELTIQEQVTKAFGDRYSIRLAERDRVGGKNLIHEYLRWKQKPKLRKEEVKYDQETASRILRQKGERAYNEYLSLFIDEEPETNLPKLQIFSHTPEGRENKELIDVIPACIPSESNPEDVAEFPGDDPYDTLRMLCKCAHRFFDESSSYAARLAKREAIVHELQTSGNQTAYHLNMERLEAEGDGYEPVRQKRRLGNSRFR